MDLEPNFRSNRLLKYPTLSQSIMEKGLEEFNSTLAANSEFIKELVELPATRPGLMAEIKDRANQPAYPQDKIIRELARLFVRKLKPD